MQSTDLRSPAGNGDSAWHALHTRHQNEKRLAEFLADRGFEIFLPLYSTVHRWKDRNKQLSLPLFPCYVFFRGGLDRKLQLLTAPGAHAIVGTAGRPGVISDAEIESIRQAVDSRFNVEPHPFLQCGDRVRIKSGSLAGLEGILVNKQNRFRLVLSVEMLGRSVAVELDALLLERIGGLDTHRIADPHPLASRLGATGLRYETLRSPSAA
jgi:transcription antitermination factor NusG